MSHFCAMMWCAAGRILLSVHSEAQLVWNYYWSLHGEWQSLQSPQFCCVGAHWLHPQGMSSICINSWLLFVWTCGSVVIFPCFLELTTYHEDMVELFKEPLCLFNSRVPIKIFDLLYSLRAYISLLRSLLTGQWLDELLSEFQ